MINWKKIYEKIVKEDAIVSAPGAVGSGEVVPGNSADSDIAPNHGTSADEVLGKCDHHKDGYLGGAGCFHVPSKVGKLHRRFELPGTKNAKKRKKLSFYKRVMDSENRLKGKQKND